MRISVSPAAAKLAWVAAAAFVATLIGAAPASFVGEAARAGGASYARATGTIWNGVIVGVVAQGAPLGDISYRLRPLSLTTGTLAADIELRGGVATGRGRVAAGLSGYALRDGDFSIDLGRIGGYGFMGAPLEGRARARVEALAYDGKGCRQARAAVWTNALDAPARRYNGEGFDLEGAARCDGADLVVDLAGSGAEGGASLALRLRPGLTYTVEASARPARAELENALMLMGFERENGMLIYASTGAIRGAGS